MAAIALWALTFLFITVGTIVGLVYRGDHMHPIVMVFMAWGLTSAAAAATVSVRFMFKRQNKLLRDAFELGKDAGSDVPVRRVH